MNCSQSSHSGPTVSPFRSPRDTIRITFGLSVAPSQHQHFGNDSTAGDASCLFLFTIFSLLSFLILPAQRITAVEEIPKCDPDRKPDTQDLKARYPQILDANPHHALQVDH
jgi:hypothetical protein